MTNYSQSNRSLKEEVTRFFERTPNTDEKSDMVQAIQTYRKGKPGEILHTDDHEEDLYGVVKLMALHDRTGNWAKSIPKYWELHWPRYRVLVEMVKAVAYKCSDEQEVKSTV